MVNIEPIPFKPTWSNERIGEVGVSKRINRFLVDENLINSWLRYHSWVGSEGWEIRISDHKPIYLQFGDPKRKVATPYKFNQTWLKDQSYKDLEYTQWQHLDQSSLESYSSLFMKGLRLLKEETIKWEDMKKFQLYKELMVPNKKFPLSLVN